MKNSELQIILAKGRTILQLDNSLLLGTQGDIVLSEDGKHFYKEGRGIPEPIILNRLAGHSSWYDSAYSKLGLTKMNWNSVIGFNITPKEFKNLSNWSENIYSKAVVIDYFLLINRRGML